MSMGNMLFEEGGGGRGWMDGWMGQALVVS